MDFLMNFRRVFLWLIPPAVAYTALVLRPFKNDCHIGTRQRDTLTVVEMHDSLLTRNNYDEESGIFQDENIVPIETFVTQATSGTTFIHLRFRFPRLCSYEYCVSDEHSNRIQGGYVETTDATSIVFEIHSGSTYVLSLKLTTENVRQRKVEDMRGFSAMKELLLPGQPERRVYSPFCHVIRADDYLAETKEPVPEVEAEDEDVTVVPDICPHTGYDLSDMSLKQREHHLKYLAAVRPATDEEIDAAVTIQKTFRGHRVRQSFGASKCVSHEESDDDLVLV